MRRMGERLRRRWQASLARRLCTDRAGNVLMLSAAIMIPMIALLGSGIDIGRVYVARSRMQQACDAASLAGRWAASSGVSSDEVKAQALQYFKFNFAYDQGVMGTAKFTPAVSVDTKGSRAVSISAKTTIPLSIMSMFGTANLPVEAECSAQQDFVNIDVVLVLDVTGSMLDPIPGESTSKIVGLRKAMKALYDQLALVEPKLKAANMRLRYGIVSYASNVNVGHLLYDYNPDWVRDPYTYSGASGAQTKTHGAAWLSSRTSWSGCIEERGTVNTINATTTQIPANAYDLDVNGAPDPSKPDTAWAPYDVATKRLATGQNLDDFCPTSEAVRLKEWKQKDFYAYADALNPQNPKATTFHDIGLAWGGRLISSTGVFGDSPDTYNGMPTNRYLIFMTDGQINPDKDVYSAWGVEKTDKRTTPTGVSDADSKATHIKRSTILCGAIKNGGASIWVVGFGNTLDPYMKNCASNSGQVSNNGSSSQLVDTFQAIGKSIGALRLSK